MSFGRRNATRHAAPVAALAALSWCGACAPAPTRAAPVLIPAPTAQSTAPPERAEPPRLAHDFSLAPSGVDTVLKAVWGSGQTVYAVGYVGTILRSRDAGRRWARLDSGTREALFGVWGWDADHVRVVGSAGVVLATDNGGAGWREIHRLGSGILEGIWGSGPTDIYVVGDYDKVYHSTDGGGSWSHQSESGRFVELNGVWGRGASEVYVVGCNGHILRSVDQGRSFTASPNPMAARKSIGPASNCLYSVTKSGDGSVLASGDDGMLLRSSDRGEHWQVVNPPLDGFVEGIGAWGASNLVAVGQPGIVVSADGGLHWQAPLATKSILSAVWVGKTAIVAVGLHGAIVRGDLD